MFIKITSDLNLLARQWDMNWAKLHAGKTYTCDLVDQNGWAIVHSAKFPPCCFTSEPEFWPNSSDQKGCRIEGLPF